MIMIYSLYIHRTHDDDMDRVRVKQYDADRSILVGSMDSILRNLLYLICPPRR